MTTQSNKMTKQFQIFKLGVTTKGKVTIVSKNGESFNFAQKVAKYKFLGYDVFDMNDNKI